MVFAFGPTVAHAAPVRGVLEFGRPAAAKPEPLRTRAYWEEWNGVLELRPSPGEPTRKAAVILTGRGAKPLSVDVDLAGGNFTQTTEVVSVGSELRIHNRDACAHELFSADMPGFGPFQTAPGSTRSVRLGRAGRVAVRDQLYSHVQMDVHVIPDLVARAELDNEGRFVFPEVEPGTYTLRVFVGDREVERQRIEVSEGQDTLLDPIFVGGGKPSAAPRAEGEPAQAPPAEAPRRAHRAPQRLR